MKRYLSLILSTCLAAIATLAQVPTFMGIPIEGPIKDFNAKIEAKGFTVEKVNTEGNIYSGTFTGEEVTVTTMPGYDNNIAMVGVYLPIKSHWNGVMADFDKYNKMYTAKYGEPEIETREFNGLTPGTTAFHDALETGEAVYRNIYIEDNIFITIGIHEGVTSETSDGYQLMILYLNDDNFIDDEDYSDDI